MYIEFPAILDATVGYLLQLTTTGQIFAAVVHRGHERQHTGGRVAVRTRLKQIKRQNKYAQAHDFKNFTTLHERISLVPSKLSASENSQNGSGDAEEKIKARSYRGTQLENQTQTKKTRFLFSFRVYLDTPHDYTKCHKSINRDLCNQFDESDRINLAVKKAILNF